MSVINQMLIDLENRHRSPVNNNAVPRGVHLSHKQRHEKSRMGLWIGLSSVLSVSLVLSYQWVSANDNLIDVDKVTSVENKDTSIKVESSIANIAIEKELPVSEVVEYFEEPQSQPVEVSVSERITEVTEETITPVESASAEVTYTNKQSHKPTAELSLVSSAVENSSSEIITSDAIEAKQDTAKPEKILIIKPESATVVRKELTGQERAMTLYQRAVNLAHDDRVEAAIEDLQGALSINHELHSARKLLAGLLLNQQRKEEAEVVLKMGLKLDSENPVYARLYAQLLTEKNDLFQALQILKNAEKYAVSDVDYIALLAVVSQRLALHEEAVFYYMSALEMDNQRGVWWMGLGISLDTLNKSVEAIRAYQIARDSGQLSHELQNYVNNRIRELAV